MSEFIHLTSKNHSLIIKSGRVPEILHWGVKIASIDKDLLLSTERPISQARLDVDVPLSLCPELGSGHFNAPGVEGHRDGLDWAPVFNTTRVEAGTTDGEANVQQAIFVLEDTVAKLELTVEIKLDYQSDVVQKRVTITNKGDSKYYLNKLSSTLPLPNHANELMTFHGRWCHEFQTQRQRFEHGGFMQEKPPRPNLSRKFPRYVCGHSRILRATRFGVGLPFRLEWQPPNAC